LIKFTDLLIAGSPSPRTRARWDGVIMLQMHDDELVPIGID
jgi:hypothetical protein